MFPLLKRDGLQIPFYIVIVLFVTLNFARHLVIENKPRTSLLHWLNLIFVFMSSAGMIFLLTLEAFVKPPLRYPDLYPALFSIFGAVNLCYALSFFLYWELFLVEDQPSVKKIS